MARTVPNKGYGGIYGEEAAGKAPGDVRASRAQKAANDFAGAEEAASREAPRNEDNTTSSSTDVAENGSASHTPQYSGNSGASASKAGKATAGGALAKATPMERLAGGLKNVFKSGDGGSSRKPLFAIGGLTGILALLMLTISSALPIHLLENFGELKNALHTINFERSNTIIRRTSRNSADPNNLFAKRNGVSSRRAAQMNKGFEGTGMRFTQNPAGGNNFVLTLDDGTTISSEAELKSRFDNDAEFRNRWNTGADIVTGRTGGWFNGAMASVLRSNFLTRNLFKDFIAGQDAADATRLAQERIAGNTDRLKKAATNTDISKTTDEDGDTEINKTTAEANTRQQIGDAIRAKAQAIASKGTLVANLACAGLLAVAAVSAAYAMAQALEGVAVVASWFEAAQKPLGGEGDDSYHAFGNMLNTATETVSFDENGSEYTLHNGEKRTPTESIGLQANLVGGISANTGAKDPSAGAFSMEKMLGGLTLSGQTIGGCIALQGIAAGAGLAVLAVEVVIAFIPGVNVVAAVGKILFDELSEGVASALIGAGLGVAINMVAPLIAMGFVTKLSTEVYGEDFGNMVASFGSRYFGKGAQGNGGAAASYNSALGMYREQQTVLAYMAETDRATRSPFDITNSNTFLGKISSNLAIASAGRGSSILGQLGAISTLSDTMSLPITLSASAATELEFREQINWDKANEAGGCARLAIIGAVGDMFCNPVRAADFSTQPLDPEFIFWKAASMCNGNECSFGKKSGGSTTHTGTHPDGTAWSVTVAADVDVDSDGLEKVNPDSDLGRMIKYGVNRSSDPGITDANILSEGAVSTGWNWLDAALGAIPIVGDVIDLASTDRQKELVDDGWVDGKAFCAGCGHPKWESTYKYLDQYIIDSNIYENMGAIEKSPVTAYIDDVLWPQTDKSYKGVLAANMGMPKGWVVETLAFADDLKNVPRDEYALVASAPNIYADYYNNGIRYNELYVPENSDPCEELNSMRECTQIAGTELRRRFNAEAVA